VLHEYAQSYGEVTPFEAYLSYALYLTPALAALLPNLHLNCHTPHAVLFVGPKYGSLSIPDLHVDQGYQQLLLLWDTLN
jgi:hypothetical protein